MVAIASSAASLAELLAPNMHDFYLKVHAFFYVVTCVKQFVNKCRNWPFHTVTFLKEFL